MRQEYRDDNPVRGVKRPADQERTALLTLDDYKALGAALKGAERDGEDLRVVNAKSGVSYASSVNRRGDHGSFSPTDTHISLMTSGPDFKSDLHDPLPTGNVDIAPTVARILRLGMPAVHGRVLEETLQGGPPAGEYAVANKTHRSSTKTGLTVKLPTDLDGRAVDPKLTKYTVGGASYTYFDQARAVRD
jgi:hypothetical protein